MITVGVDPDVHWRVNVMANLANRKLGYVNVHLVEQELSVSIDHVVSVTMETSVNIDQADLFLGKHV